MLPLARAALVLLLFTASSALPLASALPPAAAEGCARAILRPLLLNDKDTTMAHISLHLTSSARA